MNDIQEIQMKSTKDIIRLINCILKQHPRADKFKMNVPTLVQLHANWLPSQLIRVGWMTYYSWLPSNAVVKNGRTVTLAKWNLNKGLDQITLVHWMDLVWHRDILFKICEQRRLARLIFPDFWFQWVHWLPLRLITRLQKSR